LLEASSDEVIGATGISSEYWSYWTAPLASTLY